MKMLIIRKLGEVHGVFTPRYCLYRGGDEISRIFTRQSAAENLVTLSLNDASIIQKYMFFAQNIYTVNLALISLKYKNPNWTNISVP